MKTSDFDYDLPPERIAQHPAPTRDGSRLLALDRRTGAVRHLAFRDLPSLLGEGDLLVANDTRVMPARLFATVAAAPQAGAPPVTGAREVEVLLLREEPGVAPERVWTALARPAKALREGATLAFVDPGYAGVVIGTGERGIRHVAFRPAGAVPAAGAAPAFEAWLSRVGHVPLPPYIRRADEPGDRERYQTVFARETGSVAAPTAGLHFTDALLDEIRARGARVATVTLHVGPGTFRPVATEDPADHVLDPEPYRVPAETVAALETVAAPARTAGPRGRVIAVGTTCVRALESWARDGRPKDGAWRETGLFILPPYDFKVVQGMVTNFHLPRSSLLMLVSALAGRERLLAAYAEAVRAGYRFYSYGDAMLVV